MKLREKRTFFVCCLACVLLFSAPVQAMASSLTRKIEVTFRDIKIYIDGTLTTPKDVNGKVVEPFVYQGTTYLPLRAISNALGKDVRWEGDTGSVYIQDEPEITEVTVGTAAELLAALGSNKKILLKEGVYNLSSVKQGFSDSPQVYWQEVFDGNELCLEGIDNLTLQGIGAKPSEIVVSPRYAFVFSFLNSSNLLFENIKAGHTTGGYCVGGVFSFNDCLDVQIDKTEMYGCGTEGLLLDDVTNMKVSNSTIYECTYDIMTVNKGRNISFENCVFRDNKEFTLISVANTNGFTMDKCEFKNNVTGAGERMFAVSLSQNVAVKNSKFTDNQVSTLGGDDAITFENNTYAGNRFAAPK